MRRVERDEQDSRDLETELASGTSGRARATDRSRAQQSPLPAAGSPAAPPPAPPPPPAGALSLPGSALTLAVRIMRLATSRSPWWFWPISAMMKHGCCPPTQRPGHSSSSSGIAAARVSALHRPPRVLSAAQWGTTRRPGHVSSATLVCGRAANPRAPARCRQPIEERGGAFRERGGAAGRGNQARFSSAGLQVPGLVARPGGSRPLCFTCEPTFSKRNGGRKTVALGSGRARPAV